MSTSSASSLSTRFSDTKVSVTEALEAGAVRQPLDISVADQDESVRRRLKDVVELAKKELWHWERFPIVLPDPIIQSKTATLGGRHKTIHVKELFNEPNFDEVRRIALASDGSLRKLDAAQLKSLRLTGEFEVDSVEFAPLKHRWLVSRLLMKGKLKVLETFRCDLARALYFLVELPRKCIIGKNFSVVLCLNGWSQGLMSLVDMVFGSPWLETSGIKQKLHHERMKYLVAELVCTSDEELKTLQSFLRRLDQNPFTPTDFEVPPIPYMFRTPSSREIIDLRLFSFGIMRSCKPHLQRILNDVLRVWFFHRKQKLLAKLQKQQEGQGKSSSEHSAVIVVHEEADAVPSAVQLRASKMIAEDCIERICEMVSKDEKLASVGRGISELLVQQLKTTLVLAEVREADEELRSTHLAKFKEDQKQSHPILSRIQSWVKRKVKEEEEAYHREHRWDGHRRAIDVCKRKGLNASAYFLTRDMTFRKDREPVLKKELLKEDKKPCKTFEFRTKIWNPHNWIVQRVADPSKFAAFSCRKYVVRTNTTAYPFWRWTNFTLRTCAAFWNTVFYLMVVIPFCSPVSLRAVFAIRKFYPDYQFDPDTGEISINTSVTMHTVLSRFQSLLRYIHSRRDNFENTPDNLLLPKTVSRIFNIFNLYIIIGLPSVIFILLLFPAFSIIVSLMSLGLGATSIVWIPALSLVGHLFCFLFFDFEGPHVFNAVFYSIFVNILFLGVVQPILCASAAFLLCPMMFALLSAWAITRRTLRYGWDSLMFNLLLKRTGRIPARESFLARRIAGPGMSSTYFYTIKPEQALVGLETKMELTELRHFEDQMKKLIQEPLRNYYSFCRRVFSPFGVSPDKTKRGPCMELQKETDILLSRMMTELSRRRDCLDSKVPQRVLSRIRLSEADLRLVLQQSVLMAKDFFPPRVFSRLHSQEERSRFWTDWHLAEDDWLGLVCKMLKEFFSKDILTPLQKEDQSFKLSADEVSLTSYAEMIMNSDWRSDLDLARAMAKKTLPAETISAPAISVEAFNPGGEAEAGSDGVGYRGIVYLFPHRWDVYTPSSSSWETQAPMLPKCLPIPHPAEIALVIWKRDIHGEDDGDLTTDKLKRRLRAINGFDENVSDLATAAYDRPTPSSAGSSSPDVSEALLPSGEDGRYKSVRRHSSFEMDVVTMDKNGGKD